MFKRMGKKIFLIFKNAKIAYLDLWYSVHKVDQRLPKTNERLHIDFRSSGTATWYLYTKSINKQLSRSMIAISQVLVEFYILQKKTRLRCQNLKLRCSHKVAAPKYRFAFFCVNALRINLDN